jgi:hypothetical protein
VSWPRCAMKECESSHEGLLEDCSVRSVAGGEREEEGSDGQRDDRAASRPERRAQFLAGSVNCLRSAVRRRPETFAESGAGAWLPIAAPRVARTRFDRSPAWASKPLLSEEEPLMIEPAVRRRTGLRPNVPGEASGRTCGPGWLRTSDRQRAMGGLALRPSRAGRAGGGAEDRSFPSTRPFGRPSTAPPYLGMNQCPLSPARNARGLAPRFLTNFFLRPGGWFHYPADAAVRTSSTPNNSDGLA